MRRTIMLRSMHAGAAGYARLQAEGGSTCVQLHARGLACRRVRLFWYASGQTARELDAAPVNAQGEASLEALAPDDALAPSRLQALILLGDEPTPHPLLIGLCAQQSAGSLMDAKNAALALCEQLRKPAPTPAVRPVSAPTKAESAPPLPREIFLPAIDPTPYVPAAVEKPAAPAADKRSARSVEALRPLRWPKGFEKLQPFFDKAPPCALFDLPGWRFVYAAHAGGPGGLWLGILRDGGRVARVAYAQRGEKASPPWQTARGVDGAMYQVLWQTI